MYKLIFQRRENKRNNYVSYRWRRDNFNPKDLPDISFLSEFLDSSFFCSSNYFLDWLLDSDPEEEDDICCNDFRLARVGDTIIIKLGLEYFDEDEDEENGPNYELPFQEMLKILVICKRLQDDPDGPEYLIIEEEDKHFELFISDERPEELYEDEEDNYYRDKICCYCEKSLATNEIERVGVNIGTSETEKSWKCKIISWVQCHYPCLKAKLKPKIVEHKEDECCFCDKGFEKDNGYDPCRFRIVQNMAQDDRTKRYEQNFFCHFLCFIHALSATKAKAYKKRLPDNYFYIP